MNTDTGQQDQKTEQIIQQELQPGSDTGPGTAAPGDQCSIGAK